MTVVREGLKSLISGHEGELVEGLLSSLRIGGSALAAVIGNLFLMPIVAFYLLLDWNNLPMIDPAFLPRQVTALMANAKPRTTPMAKM